MHLSDFNLVDYIIIAILVISMLLGLAKGLVRELMAIIVWGLAFLVPMFLAVPLSGLFSSIVASKNIQVVIAFVVLFLVVLVVGIITSFIISQIINFSGLSGINRLGGLVFGFVRGFIIVTGIVFLLSMTSAPTISLWQASKLMPYFQDSAAVIKKILPKDTKAYFQQLRANAAGELEGGSGALTEGVSKAKEGINFMKNTYEQQMGQK